MAAEIGPEYPWICGHGSRKSFLCHWRTGTSKCRQDRMFSGPLSKELKTRTHTHLQKSEDDFIRSEITAQTRKGYAMKIKRGTCKGGDRGPQLLLGLLSYKAQEKKWRSTKGDSLGFILRVAEGQCLRFSQHISLPIVHLISAICKPNYS